MKKLNYVIFCLAVAALTGFFSSCSKKEGCTDPNAANFDPEAKESGGSCIYPNVLTDVQPTDFDAEIYGTGGNHTKTTSWTVNATQVDYSLDLTNGSSGSISVVITDAGGTVVLNETVASGAQMSKSGLTTAGVAGNWTVSITASALNGHGKLSMSF